MTTQTRWQFKDFQINLVKIGLLCILSSKCIVSVKPILLVKRQLLFKFQLLEEKCGIIGSVCMFYPSSIYSNSSHVEDCQNHQKQFWKQTPKGWVISTCAQIRPVIQRKDFWKKFEDQPWIVFIQQHAAKQI